MTIQNIASQDISPPPARTPLYARHVALGGRMTPFAGYELPVNYSGGIIAEHLFTRENAGLFDVSHMGQAFLSGADAARKFERLRPRRYLRTGARAHALHPVHQ